MSSDPAVAPDGSPVQLYLRLSGERETGWIQPALPTGSSVLDLGCGVRAALWSAAAHHVGPGGLVVVERFHPDWIRDATATTSRRDEIEIDLHDLEHRPGGLRARVTYRIDGRSYAQSFDAVALDQSALADEAAQRGLRFVRWLDDAEELALLSAA